MNQMIVNGNHQTMSSREIAEEDQILICMMATVSMRLASAFRRLVDADDSNSAFIAAHGQSGLFGSEAA